MRGSEELHTVLSVLAGIAFIGTIALYFVSGLSVWDCIVAGVAVFLCGVLGLLVV